MQRTVKGTKFTYVHNAISEDGLITCEVRTVEVPETDPKKALKKAFKEVGTFAPLKTEMTETLWVLDDETFFKYAHKVEPKAESEGEGTGE